MNVRTTQDAAVPLELGSELRGKVAFVTGGARGLGAAIVRALAMRGVSVMIGDVRREQADTLAETLRADGHNASALEVDLCDASTAMAALDQTASTLGGLDILINNAGTDRTVSID